MTVRTSYPSPTPWSPEIVDVPAPTPVTSPWLPAVLLTMATLTLEEDQAADVVRSWVVLSE